MSYLSAYVIYIMYIVSTVIIFQLQYQCYLGSTGWVYALHHRNSRILWSYFARQWQDTTRKNCRDAADCVKMGEKSTDFWAKASVCDWFFISCHKAATAAFRIFSSTWGNYFTTAGCFVLLLLVQREWYFWEHAGMLCYN